MSEMYQFGRRRRITDVQTQIFNTLSRVVSFALFCLAGLAATESFAESVDYSIEKVTGNVYRFNAGNYKSVVMVTPSSVVVTDPISREASAWLAQAIEDRWKRPIRYVIYSHNHTDHTYGGENFDSPHTDFIAHQLAREDLINTRAQTRIPNLTFTDEMVLTVDDSQVTLRYHGENNGRGSISMMFEPAGVLHVVDWVVIGRMPYKDLLGYDIQGMIDSTREILNLDFDVFVGGHADMGDKADVAYYLGYLEALYDSVRDGMLAGQDLATLKETIRLDDYQDLPQYEAWLPYNIEGVYKTLTDRSYLPMRPDVTGEW